MKISGVGLRLTVFCGLLAGSSAAMAVGCEGGVIQDRIVESIEINGESCLIIGNRIQGPVTADGSAAIVLIENDIGGRVEIQNSAFVGVANNSLYRGTLVVRFDGLVSVRDNRVRSGSIRVNSNEDANVNRNSAELNIICRNNGKLDSFFNNADANENCR